jgi:aminoglycoside phosphotransferase (APT) family kinase protein
MEELLRWLPLNITADSRSCVVHGDFRLDNLILDKTNGKVLAVLDWELSTLGVWMMSVAVQSPFPSTHPHPCRCSTRRSPQ